MNIKQLAQAMGQQEKDVAAFVDCLRVWTDKGYTVEQGIERHMTQMTRFLDNATAIPNSVAVEAFYA